ncbi:MAG: alpha/beta fold hydrolase [Burkholderiales bacterium]|nr:alpha/beta fold hydrolase [Burkholderiales bacterium]
MPIAQVNGINLYYEVAGSGEPVVFIPGLAVTTELWLFQTAFFKNEFQTISYDPRGAGRSDKPQGPYSMQDFSKDLNDLLDDLEIEQPVNLVGASMGGVIAQAFIHDYPHRVKRLVLACTGVSAGDPHVTFPPASVGQKVANPGTTLEERVDTILSISYHPAFVAKHPELRQAFLTRKTDPQPAFAYRAQLAACSDTRPYYKWLKDIKVPVLVIHGDGDLIWPLQNAHTLVKGIGENAELVVLKEAGHIFMQEQPLEFNQALLDFFKKPA